MTQSTSFMTSLKQLSHFHILKNSSLSVLEIINLDKSDVERYIEYAHSVVVYRKYLTRLGEMIIFPTLLDIFDKRQHFIHNLYILCRRPAPYVLVSSSRFLRMDIFGGILFRRCPCVRPFVCLSAETYRENLRYFSYS